MRDFEAALDAVYYDNLACARMGCHEDGRKADWPRALHEYAFTDANRPALIEAAQYCR
jgi:hypothetical protein